ncbi:hypothetical protein W824_04395 [Clavibacter cf. michiganensis LMG 26808]|nr:hypothetical protein W824_04395 [Clavibacter cf. michiganensis LMG 26808]
MAEWSWGVPGERTSVPGAWIYARRSPTVIVMARSESEEKAVGVSRPGTEVDSPRAARVASVEETMGVARILANRHAELLRRLA